MKPETRAVEARPPEKAVEAPLPEKAQPVEKAVVGTTARIDMLLDRVSKGSEFLRQKARALTAEHEARFADALELLIARETGHTASGAYRVRENGRAFVRGAMNLYPKGTLLQESTHGADLLQELMRAGVKMEPA